MASVERNRTAADVSLPPLPTWGDARPYADAFETLGIDSVREPKLEVLGEIVGPDAARSGVRAGPRRAKARRLGRWLALVAIGVGMVGAGLSFEPHADPAGRTALAAAFVPPAAAADAPPTADLEAQAPTPRAAPPEPQPPAETPDPAEAPDPDASEDPHSRAPPPPKPAPKHRRSPAPVRKKTPPPRLEPSVQPDLAAADPFVRRAREPAAALPSVDELGPPEATEVESSGEPVAAPLRDETAHPSAEARGAQG